MPLFGKVRVIENILCPGFGCRAVQVDGNRCVFRSLYGRAAFDNADSFYIGKVVTCFREAYFRVEYDIVPQMESFFPCAGFEFSGVRECPFHAFESESLKDVVRRFYSDIADYSVRACLLFQSGSEFLGYFDSHETRNHAFRFEYGRIAYRLFLIFPYTC